MVERYVAIRHRPVKSEYAWEYRTDRLAPVTIVVSVEADDPVPTGLYDVTGVELYRVPERGPCGFHKK
jgi:hypothetical protein